MDTRSQSLPKSLSLKRYNSEEMSSVVLDSPRGVSTRHTFSLSFCDQLCGDSVDGGSARSPPFSDDSDAAGQASQRQSPGPARQRCALCCYAAAGGATRAEVATSWVVPSRGVVVGVRALLFVWLACTCASLGARGALRAFSVSAEIYVMQVVAAGLMLAATIATPPRRRPRGAVSPRWRGGGGVVLRTAATVLLQSTAGLVLFWDVVYWTQLKHPLDVATPDVALLHLYNCVPVFIEVMFGCTVFRAVYFLPGLLFVGTYLGLLGAGGIETGIDDWVYPLFFGNTSAVGGGGGTGSHWVETWVLLMCMYCAACVAIYAVQKVRQFVSGQNTTRQVQMDDVPDSKDVL